MEISSGIVVFFGIISSSELVSISSVSIIFSTFPILSFIFFIRGDGACSDKTGDGATGDGATGDGSTGDSATGDGATGDDA